MKRPVVIALLALCGLSCGCRDRFDVPDTPADAPAANITIASLHAFLHAETVVVREELTVGGTVVSSDEAGNFYRTLVLDDGTGGAELRIAEYNLYTICPPGCRLPFRCGVVRSASGTAYYRSDCRPMRTAPTRPATSPRAYCSNGCCILRANGRNPSLHRAKSHDSARRRAAVWFVSTPCGSAPTRNRPSRKRGRATGFSKTPRGGRSPSIRVLTPVSPIGRFRRESAR